MTANDTTHTHGQPAQVESLARLSAENARLAEENEELRLRLARKVGYIRAKVDQMLTVMGTLPLEPEELDDETLTDVDPIGIVCDSFRQILASVNETNDQLRQSEERYRDLFENANDLIQSVDQNGSFLYVNRAWKETMGYTDQDIAGLTVFDVITPVCQDHCLVLFQQVMAGAKIGHVEVEFVAKDGRQIQLEGSVNCSFVDGKPVATRSIFRDITKRKAAEQELKESEARFKTIIESIQAGVMVIDCESHVIVDVNPAAAALIGLRKEEIVGHVCHKYVCPAEEKECPISDLGQTVDNSERRLWTGDGREIPILKTVTTIRLKGRDHLLESFVDISQRKQAEQALAMEKERLAVTLRSIGDGVITTDTNGRIVLINKVAEQLTGWPQGDAAGRLLEEVFHIVSEKTGERCENPVNKVLKTGSIVTLANHTALVTRDGRRLQIADSGAPICDRESTIIGVVLVFRDVSETQRMEVELQKAQKLESVGVLAGGIAHDFNNLLTGILGNISLAKMLATPGEAIQERLVEAEKASCRARDLTHQLLTFSRGGAPVKRTASIINLLRDSTSFALRGSSVRSHFNLPQNLWPVEMDEGQISQVIHNLAINASQAMPHGGELYLTAENRVVTEADGLPVVSGDYVAITMRDTGNGIAPENLAKIFDPYFTTKNKGSGLGLATSYSIIVNHDGYITVESEPGHGTAFHVFLPASCHEAPPERQESSLPVTGKGKILLMDDEAMILDVAGAILKHIGYSVTFAKDGEEALKRYEEALLSGEPFAAVIMDLTIPGGMGGKDAVQRLLAMDPTAKTIVSSGYSHDPVMANYRQYGFQGCVLKPYIIDELSSVLHDVIATRTVPRE